MITFFEVFTVLSLFQLHLEARAKGTFKRHVTLLGGSGVVGFVTNRYRKMEEDSKLVRLGPLLSLSTGISDAYEELSQTSRMELFAKIVNGFKLLTTFFKGLILDV